jgi:hypothetical protein
VKENDVVMSNASGWFEKDLLETFYLIVEEYRTDAISESAFFNKIFTIAERYGRHAGKEEANRNQMSLLPSSPRKRGGLRPQQDGPVLFSNRNRG